MIDLYTWATPNGRKISIALEEMKLLYKVYPVDLQKEEQFNSDFLRISPNNKIPAIVDNDNGVSVFESGAILTYLAEKTGQFLPIDLSARVKVLEWLAWQTAGLGPMLGQLNHFLNIADQKHPYAIKRFSDEAIRLLAVLDKQLADQNFIAGEYSIADMAVFPWSEPAYQVIKDRLGETFQNIEIWHERMLARPAVQIGMNIPRI